MEKDLIILAAGVVVGTMNAIAGGGMLIGFPILVALGVPPLVANVTSNIITPPGQLTAIGGYREYIKRIPTPYALLFIPVTIGALSGALLLRHTSMDSFAAHVPWLILFGVVLFAFQPIVHLRLHRHMRRKRRKYSLLPLLLLGLAVTPISVYGGYFGAGYGFMMLAFLGLGNIHEVHTLAAMKNMSAVVVSVISIVCLYSTGMIDWRVGTIMAVGTACGGYLGAHVGKKIPSRWLRIAVITIGLGAALHLALQHYR